MKVRWMRLCIAPGDPWIRKGSIENDHKLGRELDSEEEELIRNYKPKPRRIDE
jgi:hypothetical protein